MDDLNLSPTREVKPLRPNLIAGVMFSISLLFSIYYSISNNYGFLEFFTLISFGFVISAAAWGLMQLMNNVKRKDNSD